MSFFAIALMVAAAADDCRMVPVSENGKRRDVLMCRDADGQFRPRKNATEPKALPSDFQGQIVYEGTIDGVSYVQSTRRPTRSRGLGLGSLIGGDVGRALNEVERAATTANVGKANDMVEDGTYGGQVQITMYIDGNFVKMTAQPLQARDLVPITLTGTRAGSTCTLFDNQGKASWEGRCDGNGFDGRGDGVISEAPRRRTWSQTIQARTVSLKTADDIALEQRQREVEIAAARAEAQRAQEALIARMQAGKPLADRLDAIVTVDSQSWMFNRYQRGSITNVNQKPTGGGKGNYVATASFAYASGAPGSIQVKMVGDRIDCVEFGDFPGECRPLGMPSSYGVTSELMMSALTSSGSSSVNDEGCVNTGYLSNGKPFCF